MLQSEEGPLPTPGKAPILYLDVNIADGKSAKLMIFDGDDIHYVVETFAEFYDLSQKKQEKLLDIVNRQM